MSFNHEEVEFIRKWPVKSWIFERVNSFDIEICERLLQKGIFEIVDRKRFTELEKEKNKYSYIFKKYHDAYFYESRELSPHKKKKLRHAWQKSQGLYNYFCARGFREFKKEKKGVIFWKWNYIGLSEKGLMTFRKIILKNKRFRKQQVRKLNKTLKMMPHSTSSSYDDQMVFCDPGSGSIGFF